MKYFVISITSGLIFGILDGLINANPYAKKLFTVYKPIANTTINVPLGFAIDLIYGFVMAGLFLVLYQSLPGKTRLMKGLSYGLIIWFFRVVMYAFSQLIMFKVPVLTIIYILVTGLVEVLIIGVFYALILKD